MPTAPQLGVWLSPPKRSRPGLAKRLQCRVWQMPLPARELAATPVHVGLECGFFLQKRPDLDCISIGPDAGNLHSPEEWLSIPSTMRMFEFIKEIVRKVIE